MRSVLILSYYFPPAGGPGVQRVLKAVKHLPEFGVHPVVVTVRPERGAFPSTDASLLEEVPCGVEVIRTGALDPFSAYARLIGTSRQKSVKVGSVGHADSWQERLAQRVRANVVLPDARVGWVPFAVRAAQRAIERLQGTGAPVEVLLTSGPPHSTHLAGRYLARSTGLPWVADFRDPWTDINFYDELPMTAPARTLDRAAERSVLRMADRIVTVSPWWRRLLASKVQRAAAAFVVVENGVDEADFASVWAEPPTLPETFRLVHVGSLYGARNPEALWEALHRLRDDGRRVPVRLVGRVGEGVEHSIAAYNLTDQVEVVPYLPHDEAVREMACAPALLLSVEPFPADLGMMTGKLYEYLASGRPVVALGPPGGDADQRIRALAAGRLFARSDVEDLAAHLGAMSAAWERGERPRGASRDALRPFTRRAQTERLAEVLHDLSHTP